MPEQPEQPRNLQPLASKGKPTKVEEAKINSRHLRGTIKEVLHDDTKPVFDHDDLQLLKFHGSYQQDDRDARAAVKALGTDPVNIFMLRIKIPGGVLSPEQYLGMDQLAEEVTHDDALRVTTRQNFQLHGVIKGDLKQTIKRTNEVLLSTLCGCGDVARNIMAPPAPLATPGHKAVRALAQTLSDALCPQTKAYYEIWLNGEQVHSSEEETEPLYGDTYLPRKFKTGIALPEDNSVDAHSQDVALIAILKDGKFQGVNVLVGGGLGMTHKMESTYARLGSQLGYADAEHAVEVVRTVAVMFRDYGDRTDRKHARLKYVLEEYGVEAFRADFQSRVSFQLKPWVQIPPLEHQDWLGAHDQGDGKFLYGVFIPNGRIIDSERCRMKTAFRKIVQSMRLPVVLTPTQNILFTDLSADQVKAIEKVLNAYNVPTVASMSWVRRGAVACPALPTCGLALTEAERVMPEVVDLLEQEFQRVGLADEPITIRMTGCPNGCARPYTADVGLVGHKPGHYDIFLGGSIHGERMAEFYALNVPMLELGKALRPILVAWKQQRSSGESLGDFYDRVFSAPGRRRDLLTGSRDNPAQERVLALPVLQA
jgi:sulfite reductase (ferredoxin)